VLWQNLTTHIICANNGIWLEGLSMYKVLLFICTSVACVIWPKCYHVLNWFFFPKPGFLKIYLNFQRQKSLKNQYLSHSESNLTKWIPLNLAHQDLSNNTKATFQFLRNFQLQFYFIFSEEIIHYSRTFAPQVQMSWSQAHAPLLLESFPRRPRMGSEASWFCGSRKYWQNKTNKLPCFRERLNENLWGNLGNHQ